MEIDVDGVWAAIFKEDISPDGISDIARQVQQRCGLLCNPEFMLRALIDAPSLVSLLLFDTGVLDLPRFHPLHHDQRSSLA